MMTSMLDSKANRPRCEPSTKREKGSNKLNLLSIDKVAGALGLFQVVLSGGHDGVWVAKKEEKIANGVRWTDGQARSHQKQGAQHQPTTLTEQPTLNIS